AGARAHLTVDRMMDRRRNERTVITHTAPTIAMPRGQSPTRWPVPRWTRFAVPVLQNGLKNESVIPDPREREIHLRILERVRRRRWNCPRRVQGAISIALRSGGVCVFHPSCIGRHRAATLEMRQGQMRTKGTARDLVARPVPARNHIVDAYASAGRDLMHA